MVQVNQTTMTQQEKVIQVFNDLLKGGDTTTLDVKLELREQYPIEYWTQDFVSQVISNYVDDNHTITYSDNGQYRVYKLKSTIPLPSIKTYSFTTKDGVKIEADTWLAVVETAMKLGENIHWSQSKQQFFGLWELQDNHLLNIIRRDTEGLSAKEYANYMQTNPYALELYSRH